MFDSYEQELFSKEGNRRIGNVFWSIVGTHSQRDGLVERSIGCEQVFISSVEATKDLDLEKGV